MPSKRIATFRSLSMEEKALFFEAVFCQVLIWFLLLWVPFRKMIPQQSGNSGECKPFNRGLLIMVKEATARANTLAFWKNRCLVQSLAARNMLARRGIVSTLHLGFTASPHGEPSAHAWLQVGDFEVVNKGSVELVLFKNK
jgi:hypothetical protein